MKEKCVNCGEETEYDISTPIEFRRNYIGDGAGQLCQKCAKKIYPNEVLSSFN